MLPLSKLEIFFVRKSEEIACFGRRLDFFAVSGTEGFSSDTICHYTPLVNGLSRVLECDRRPTSCIGLSEKYCRGISFDEFF